MREDFEALHSSLIEVDLYCRSSRITGCNSDVSSIDFKTGCGSSGVDLQYNRKEDVLKISRDKKDGLMNWLTAEEGMKQNKSNFKSSKNKNGRNQKYKAKCSDGNWKSKFRKAIKTD